jgi:hypothetical protein
MTICDPPRMATSILKRFASAPDEPMVGDLFEEYQRRRSTLWYWFQVLAAIGVGAWHDLRPHKFVAVGAILTGAVIVDGPFLILISTPAARFASLPIPVSIKIIAAQLLMMLAAMTGGLVVSRLFPLHRGVAVLSLALALAAEGAVLLPRLLDAPLTAVAGITLLYSLLAIVGGSVSPGRSRLA